LDSHCIITPDSKRQLGYRRIIMLTMEPEYPVTSSALSDHPGDCHGQDGSQVIVGRVLLRGYPRPRLRSAENRITLYP